MHFLNFFFIGVIVMTSTSTITSGSDKAYYTDGYQHDHWAIQPYTLSDPKVVALAYHDNHEYAIYANPRDRRGYRSIVRFIDNNDMTSTINRDYSSEESKGLALVVRMVADAYWQIVPIAQSSVAGNNAHGFDPETRTTYLGKPSEPNFLHAHIYGRGDPESEYIAGVKLGGPEPGKMFDMRAKTPNEAGNDSQVRWKDDEMQKVVNRLRAEIDKVKASYPELSIVM